MGILAAIPIAIALAAPIAASAQSPVRPSSSEAASSVQSLEPMRATSPLVAWAERQLAAQTGRRVDLYWGDDSYSLPDRNVVVVERRLLIRDGAAPRVDMAVLQQLGRLLVRSMPTSLAVRPQPGSKEETAWADFFGGELMGFYLAREGGTDRASLTQISTLMADFGGAREKSVDPTAGQRVRLWNLGMASGHARAVPDPASYNNLMVIAGRKLPNDPSGQSYLTFVSQSIGSILSGGQ